MDIVEREEPDNIVKKFKKHADRSLWKNKLYSKNQPSEQLADDEAVIETKSGNRLSPDSETHKRKLSSEYPSPKRPLTHFLSSTSNPSTSGFQPSAKCLTDDTSTTVDDISMSDISVDLYMVDDISLPSTSKQSHFQSLKKYSADTSAGKSDKRQTNVPGEVELKQNILPRSCISLEDLASSSPSMTAQKRKDLAGYDCEKVDAIYWTLSRQMYNACDQAVEILNNQLCNYDMLNSEC